MADPKWAEDKGRVDAHLNRHDGELSKQDARVTRISSELYGEIDGVKETISEMNLDLKTQATRIETKLDLVHADVRNGQTQKGQTLTARISGKFMVIVALITAATSLIVALFG